uniref:Uncharacterized protein n=1 Tax=Ursus maritimus TaxID=29073 RepID=A0A452T3S7_URSMA
VHALNDVTAVVEHTANVLGVHSASEVGVAVVAAVPTSSADSLRTNERTAPRHKAARTILRSSVASKLWKVVLNLRFSSEDFLGEQVLLVEEQDHGDGLHKPVVPDALEQVQSLLQAVGLVVLPDDHVVAAAGHHEDNGGHIFTLDPFAAFVALGAIHLLEVDFVHLELGLKDSRSQDAAAKQILKQKLVSLLDDIDLVQERGYSLLGAVNQLVLVGALVAGTHSFVLPQSLGILAYGREIEVRYVHHAQNIVHSELVLRVGQLHGRHQVAHGGHDDTYFDRLFQVVFDVLHFGRLLTTVGLKRERHDIASCGRTGSL